MHTYNKSRLATALVCLLLFCSDTGADTIHNAVKNGDMAGIKVLAERDREALNKQDESGKSPLHHAIEMNYTDIARYLIAQGANTNLTDNDNESPLHYSASAGNLEIARLLLDGESVSLNDTSAVKRGGSVGNWTPLHLACLNSHPDMVQLLLEYGADIEATDGVKRTPLILSVEGGDMQVVRILVENGADINAQAIRSYTALLWAARNGFEEMVNYLVDRGAAIEPDVLQLAFQMAVLNGMDRLLELVLEQGFNIEEIAQRDPDFICPAAAGGSARVVELLVGYGFVLEQADKDGWTPLHYAASEGHVDVIEYMLTENVAIDARNLKGETAYNLATKSEDKKAADYLKMKGCDTGEPQFPVIEGPYMGQQPPGDIPELFMPGIVSGYSRAHSSIVFSPDGKEAYWTEMDYAEGSVKVSHMVSNRWSYPVVAELDRDPSISPDGSRLFFIKTRPFRPGEEPGGDPDVKEEYWFLERVDSGWSAPISVGDEVNAIGVHWPCSIDKDGNLYFSEFKDNMYFSEYVDGRYQEPVRITEHFGNATLVGHSPFISPDMDYLLFSTDNGLCISFRKNDGTWTDGINLGNEINGSHVNVSPQITHDGKYMFFVSAGQGRSWGIYWVSTSFIERLRAEHLLDK
ncbi:MAG: ankyrin repeat domain-containing protein [candidate division Zixibacteria bacterium]